jgi:hypothetical protein
MSPDEMKLQRDVPLSVADSKHERSFAIREADWNRIRGDVEKLEVGQSLIEHAPTWASTAAGAGAGTLITAIVLMASDSKTEPWLIPALWIAVFFSAAFAVCFWLVGSSERKRHNLDVKGVCDAMDTVSAPFNEKDSASRNAIEQAHSEYLENRARRRELARANTQD